MDEKRREVAFLVRMWLPQGADDVEWRGLVQEVASGKRLFVTGTRDIADFIAIHLADQNVRGQV